MSGVWLPEADREFLVAALWTARRLWSRQGHAAASARAAALLDRLTSARGPGTCADGRDGGRWWTSDEVAAELGVTPRQVRRLAESGAFMSRRTGVGWLVHPASVAEHREVRNGRRQCDE